MSHHATLMPEAATRPMIGTSRVARLEHAAAGGAVRVLIVIVGVHLAFVGAQSNLELVGRIGGLIAVALGTAAAFGASLSRRPLVRSAGAITLGTVGLGAGLGIAPVWLWAAGPSPTAAFAAAGTLAAAALLIYGSLALLITLRRWWRLLLVPLAFALVQFALIPLAGAFYGTHPPRTAMSGSIPEAAERVTFRTDDGVAHVAWYLPARNGTAVVLLAGSGGDKGSTIAHAARLARHGYGVLAVDSRGTGESGGIANAWGWGGEGDVRAAVDWLTERPEIRPEGVGLVGLSMGGEIAITAAAQDHRVGAVVAEGVSARVPEDLEYLPADPLGTIERIEGWIMWTAADLMTDAPTPLPLTDLVAEVGPRLLLVVGNDAAETRAAPRFHAAAPSITIWALPDTGHIRALATHPDEWEDRVVGFLAERLGVDDPVTGRS